jgi:hypothetical protein
VYVSSPEFMISPIHMFCGLSVATKFDTRKSTISLSGYFRLVFSNQYLSDLLLKEVRVALTFLLYLKKSYLGLEKWDFKERYD